MASDAPSPTRALTPTIVAAVTVLALLCAGLVLLFAASGNDDGGGGPSASDEDDGTRVDLTPAGEIGDPLTTSITPGSAGTEETTLAALVDGSPVVVNFFASTCVPCITELPEFVEADAERDDVDFVGVAVADREADAAEMVDNAGVTYPWYQDRDGSVLLATESTLMPTTIFVTAEGALAHVRAGQLSGDELRALIDEHLTTE